MAGRRFMCCDCGVAACSVGCASKTPRAHRERVCDAENPSLRISVIILPQPAPCGPGADQCVCEGGCGVGGGAPRCRDDQVSESGDDGRKTALTS